jgi:hypothetical protein
METGASMRKLIENFKSDSSQKNARKLINYIAKHPFTIATLGQDDLAIYIKAKSVKMFGK